jgi:hypothetical protein
VGAGGGTDFAVTKQEEDAILATNPCLCLSLSSVCGACGAREAASAFGLQHRLRIDRASHRTAPPHPRHSSTTTPSDSGPPSATSRIQRLDCEQLPEYGKHPTPSETLNRNAPCPGFPPSSLMAS